MAHSLRLEHRGYAQIDVRYLDKVLTFDPHLQPIAKSTVVLTWNWADKVVSTARATREGMLLNVHASPLLQSWVVYHQGWKESDSKAVRILRSSYTPLDKWSYAEQIRRALSPIFNPREVARRLWYRFKIPQTSPDIVLVEFPSGASLLHLNLSVYENAPKSNWEKALELVRRKSDPNRPVTWVLVGCDYHRSGRHGKVLLEQLKKLSAEHIVFCDLLGDFRRDVGLPASILTPLVDQAITEGLNAHILAPHASYRFETVDLLGA